ncbi:MAG: STAS domain-containing protein [Planctomycetota bacterium]
MSKYEDLKIEITHRDTDCVIMIMAESLMHAEAPELSKKLLAAIIPESAASQRVLIDFSRVVHMNSNAVSVLLMVKTGLESRGCSFAVINASLAIRNFFKYMCLESALPIIDD